MDLCVYEVSVQFNQGMGQARILAMQKAASSSLPIQPEQTRVTGDSEQEDQKGGTPT